MTEQDPYSSPSADLDEEVLNCPKCSRELERGELRSSSRVRWVADSADRWDMFVKGEKDIAQISTGLGCRYQAYHCPVCRLYLLA